MSKKYKILLLQLPNPEFALHKRWGNVPLAAGYLKAMAQKENLLDQVDIEILDKKEMDQAGDARLIELVVAMAPDLLGLSLYIWNARRSMYIIREIKKRLPGIKILVGGPEVTTDSPYIFQEESIDLGCFGEGESTFIEIVRNILHHSNGWSAVQGIFYRHAGGVTVNPRRGFIKDLDAIPSPYLLGTFDFAQYPVLCYETLRGCKNSCTYCCWANVPLRHFSSERIIEELALIIKSGVKTVRFADSSPLIHPDFMKTFQKIRELNKEAKVEFTACVYFDDITEEITALLKKCNFTYVEIGLQTANDETLKRLRRPPLDKRKFVQSIRLLERYGVKYELDMLIGLPGESYSDYQETVQFVISNDLNPAISFILMVLPNTQIRRDAKKYGLQFQKDPPYKLINSATMSSADLKLARSLNQFRNESLIDGNVCICSYDTDFLKNTPLFRPTGKRSESLPEIINRIIIDLAHQQNITEKQLSSIYHTIGYPFTIWLKAGSSGSDLTSTESFLTELARFNPFLLVTIILECPDIDSFHACRHLLDFVKTEEIKVNSRGPTPTLRKYVIFQSGSVDDRDIQQLRRDFDDITQVFSCQLSRESSWRDHLAMLPANQPPSNLLIEVKGKFDISQIIGFFDSLSDGNYRNLLFRNGVLFMLHETYKSFRSGNPEKVLQLANTEAIISIKDKIETIHDGNIDNQTKMYLAWIQMKFLQLLHE